MMPNSFLILLGQPNAQTTAPFYETNGASLYISDLNPNFLRISRKKGGFDLFIGEACQPAPDSPPNVSLSAGTQITLSEKSSTLTIKCDRLGTAIIYWKKEGNQLLLSNRKENLITLNDEPDWSSIQQYLHTGFTIQSRTLIKGISQMEPNTILDVSFRPKLNVSISLRSDISVDMKDCSTDLLDQVAERLSRKLRQTPPSVLMMSAGWDSRTLLLPGASHLAGAYTHGDLSSREIGLARKLTGDQRLDHLFVDVQSSPVNLALIDKMLHELGSGIFPSWYIAAQNVRGWKNAPIMSGVLGELLGGHYGIMSWGSRSRKLLSSLLLVDTSLVSTKQIHKTIDRYCTPPMSHWFISAEGQEILDANRKETHARAKDTITKYYDATGDWQRTLEEFNMAHRGRQYILKQAQAAANSVGYTIPFADEQLSDLVRGIKFKHRLHNKANQRILRSQNPALLKAPMAATLIAARHPILFQELSRFVRIARENLSVSLGKDKPRLGWFNYEHLYESTTLHDLADSLTQPIWDKSKMHASLKTNTANGIDAGSTLDMLCKIKTIDYYLNMIGNH